MVTRRASTGGAAKNITVNGTHHCRPLLPNTQCSFLTSLLTARLPGQPHHGNGARKWHGHGTFFRSREVTLPPNGGSLHVTTATSGSSLDPDGYTVSVDVGTPQAVSVNGSRVFTDLTASSHSIRLDGLAANCTVSGDNPLAVTIAAGRRPRSPSLSFAHAPTGDGQRSDYHDYIGELDRPGWLHGERRRRRRQEHYRKRYSPLPASRSVRTPSSWPGWRPTASYQATTLVLCRFRGTDRHRTVRGQLCRHAQPQHRGHVSHSRAPRTHTGDVPLVQGRNAFLRVFVVANGSNTAKPTVRVRLYQGGTLAQTLTINARRGSTPTGVQEGTLSSSWNIPVPASLIAPGLSVLADVDPSNAIAETNETDNSFLRRARPNC